MSESPEESIIEERIYTSSCGLVASSTHQEEFGSEL